MTYAPQTLKDLAALWAAQGGVNLGIVGDTGHVATGTSYHLGEDQLADGAYSAKLPRDVAGLTNAASAIDLGKLDGTLVNLQAFSRWLVAWCMAGGAGARDVREVIYSPDGFNVKRYDATTGAIYDGGTGTGQGDDSHRTHTHISYWRDSEFRDKREPFLAYFNQPDTGTGDDMAGPVIVNFDPNVRGIAAVRSDVGDVGFINSDGSITSGHAGERWGAFGQGDMQGPITGPVYQLRVAPNDALVYVKVSEATLEPSPGETTLGPGLYRVP